MATDSPAESVDSAAVAPDEAEGTPEDPEADPESFTEVAKDNILVKVALGLLVTLGVLALLLALAR